MNPVKLHNLPLVALVVLACPALTRADTVYYEKSGSNGIESVAGTIVQETDSHLEIQTEDGRTVSIPRQDVFKIIRDTPSSSSGYAPNAAEYRTTHGTHFEAGYPDSDPDTSRPARIYHYGIKGGMNVSNMNVDPQVLEENDSLTSYALGAWMGLPLNRRLTVQAEALYSVKGDSESSGGYTASTRMAYIDVPVVAKIGFRHDSPARPSLFLGPSLAINLSANSKLEGEGNEFDVDIKDDVRTFDLGLVVGGGVDFAVGKRTVGVELRYSKGLSNIAGDGANGTARHDVIALLGSVGFK